jgi:hypothetical protein
MYNDRSNVRIYRNAIGGVIAGIFIICLAVAIYLWGFSADWFLPILFLGLGLASLIGSFTSPNRKAAYGSLYGVVWFLGLSLCFWIGFWPWILLPVGFSIILGALAAPILGAMRNGNYPPANQQYPATYQPYQPYQSLLPQQPYWSPQQEEQGNQELHQEQDTQQEVEQQHQQV